MSSVYVQEISLEEAQERIRNLGHNIPWFLRYVGRQIVESAKREAVLNASNVIIRRRTGALVGWVRQQKPAFEEHAVSWGLPKGNKESMIGQVLNEGKANITSRTGQFLRIPIPGGPADQGAGVDPYSGVPLRTIEGFFVAKSAAGNPVIFRALDRKIRGVGKAGAIVPWYVLKASVTIPPHPWFGQAVTTTESLIPNIIEARLFALEQQRHNEDEVA